MAELVAYVGPDGIHDATILAIEHRGEVLDVLIQPLDGDPFSLEFSGVTDVKAIRPVGMMLYGLSEWRVGSDTKLFIFMNWHEDDASLEVHATGFVASSGI